MKKNSFAYFPQDPARFSSVPYRRLKRLHGIAALMVYEYLISRVYCGEGYMVRFDDDTLFDVSDYFEMEEAKVREIIEACVDIGLFDRKMFQGGVLTSKELQEQFLDMSARAKRRGARIPEEFCLLSPEAVAAPAAAPVQESNQPVINTSKTHFNNNGNNYSQRHSGRYADRLPVEPACGIIRRENPPRQGPVYESRE